MKRFRSILVKLMLKIEQGSSDPKLINKYKFYKEVESILTKKIVSMKLKLSHLSRIVNLYPIVPSEFSNELSLETKLLKDQQL